MPQQTQDSGVVLVMIGPMGCGKTTIGKLLSSRLNRHFYDADDFHPPENVSKMRAGIPLEDSDRFPWLKRLHDEIQTWLRQDQPVVLACSALKKTYRDMLGIDQKSVISVYLKGPFALIHERIVRRSHQYMPEQLLRSQFEALEEPRSGITVDISPPPEQIVNEIVSRLEGLPRP